MLHRGKNSGKLGVITAGGPTITHHRVQFKGARFRTLEFYCTNVHFLFYEHCFFKVQNFTFKARVKSQGGWLKVVSTNSLVSVVNCDIFFITVLYINFKKNLSSFHKSTNFIVLRINHHVFLFEVLYLQMLMGPSPFQDRHILVAMLQGGKTNRLISPLNPLP